MVSPVGSVLDQIVTDLEALTPPDETGYGYRHVGDGTAKEIPDGASAHRCFWFVLVSGGWEHDFAPDMTIEETVFQIRLRLNTSENALTTFFKSQVNEATQIQRTINNRQAWPAGVDIVHVNRYFVERATSDDVDMVLECSTRTQET